MHDGAYEFARSALELVWRAYPDRSKLAVLEVGSFNVNGTVRPLLRGVQEYIGIDRQAGPGVDEVSDVRDWGGQPVGLVVSTEAMEHDSNPERMFKYMADLVAPGGFLLVTAAAPGREPHNSSGHPWDGVQPYHTVEPEELRAWARSAGLREERFEHVPLPVGDVYGLWSKPAVSKVVAVPEKASSPATGSKGKGK
jgi:hypothetical protein